MIKNVKLLLNIPFGKINNLFYNKINASAQKK